MLSEISLIVCTSFRIKLTIGGGPFDLILIFIFYMIIFIISAHDSCLNIFIFKYLPTVETDEY